MKLDNSYTARRTGGDLLAALTRCQIAWQKGEFWNDFIEALATVEATAMQAGHLALHDVCIALHKRIVQLSEVQPCPDDDQCAVLATWPSLASAWAESQGEPRMGELLVEFLRHPMWPQPLDSDEAETLGVMLGVESGAYGTESLMETVTDTLYTTEADDSDGDGDGDGVDSDGLAGYDGLSGYAKLGTAGVDTGKIVPDVRARMTGDGTAPAADVEVDRKTPEEAATAAPVAATPMLRVPAPLVDDLLRLVGEAIVLSGQIQERLSVTARETENMRKQYTLVQRLGREMEELIDLQDLSPPRQRVAGGEKFDALEFDQYHELHTCARRLVEAATDSREVGRSIDEHLSALSDMLSDQSRLNRENQEAVLKTRMVAVQTIVPRLRRSVR